MYFVRLTAPEHPMFAEAMDLYRASFPYHEQREEASQRAALAREEYHFNLICREAEFVGLLLCWEGADFVYVEHFCTLPALRGRGFGAQALALLGAGGKRVILEIDPPVDETARRREGFYRRAGFCVNPYAHVHPPYHAGHGGHALVVLSAPGGLTPEEYDSFADFLRAPVMDGV